MPEICIGAVEYSFQNDIPLIHLFGRDKEGTLHRVDVTQFSPYFYAPITESNRITPDLTVDKQEFTSILKEPLMKIYIKKPTDIYDVRDRFTHYEADVHFNTRFLIDTGIKSGVSFPQSSCKYTDLKPIDLNYKARVNIVDIECSDARGFPDSSKDEILCITCYDSFTKHYTTFIVETTPINYTPRENGCFNPDIHDVMVYPDEKALLIDFCEYIKVIDPDILTGWNFTGFDMPYILGRLDKMGIARENLSRLRGNSQRMEIRGRQLFDLLAGYKRMHLGEKPSYRLDAIAQDELGRGKVHFNGKICELWGDNPTEFLFYNFVDVELCVAIDQKDETIEFHRYTSQYIGCPLEKTTNSMPLIDVLVLREAKENGFVLPSKATTVDHAESFEGATVIAPMIGVKENVIVLDLKSLYPMAMLTINASPETKSPTGELHSPNGIKFLKEPDGLVRKIQLKFLRERDEMKRERNKHPFGSPEYKLLDMKQDVIKVNMNSYYGVSGNPMFRLNDRDVGSAITSVGRAILEHNKKIVEERGYKIAQGDSVGKNSKVIFYNETGGFKFYGTISEAFDIFSKSGFYKDGEKEYCVPIDTYTDTIDSDGKLALKKVKHLMRHDCGKKMYRVSITNRWFVDVTEDHSLIGYKNSKQLTKQDQNRLVELKPADVGKITKSVIVKKLSSRSVDDNNDFPKEMYELVGYFIGCGSFEATARRLSLAGGEDCEEVVDKIFKPLEKHGWVSKWYIKSEKKGDICFYGKANGLIKIATRVGAIGKKIPDFIYTESFENQCAFLRGLFSSDGTCMFRKGNPMVRYCSVHKHLCEEIQVLLHMVGISSSVFRDNTVNSYSGIVSGTYSHLVSIKSLEQFSKYVGFIESRKQERIANHVAKKKKHLEFVNYDISTVKEVKEIDYSGYVYDISVEGVHNFFANNILVHNTDGLALVIPKSIGREGTIAIAKDLERILNESYSDFAREQLGADVSYFSVKFEKLFERFFSGGKKKRYAGLLTWKEGVEAHEVSIVGFETERSDSPTVTRTTMKSLISMVLEGKEYSEIQPVISEIIRKYRAREYSLDEIGIPGGIGKELDDYESPDAQVRGAIYSNKYLGTHFGKGSKPKRLYIKSMPFKYPRTDVICFEYADEVPSETVVDKDLMLEKTMEQPIRRILEPLGWAWEDFDPGLTTLKKWGIG